MCILLMIALFVFFFFFKQKTAYEMRISDWSSDVCSSDLQADLRAPVDVAALPPAGDGRQIVRGGGRHRLARPARWIDIETVIALEPQHTHAEQIGRASCRERVCQYV